MKKNSKNSIILLILLGLILAACDGSTSVQDAVDAVEEVATEVADEVDAAVDAVEEAVEEVAEEVAEEVEEITLHRLEILDLLKIGLVQNHLRTAGIIVAFGFTIYGEISEIFDKKRH